MLTPEEMAAVDAAAPEPVEVLIGRAGFATARAAVDLLGGTYGRRVVVLAGKGNNGNDGRDAARRLRRRGARVQVVEVADAPSVLPPCDLVIDAAFGTGFRGEWSAPDPGPAPVLALDIPSGVSGLTGEVGSTALVAERTITFAALKPGLLLPPGSGYVGEVEVADIGLDTSAASAHLVEATDVGAWVPRRSISAHKWESAVWVVGGSPGLEGAAVLAASAAIRSGAGYVRWSSPGGLPGPAKPLEVVGTALPQTGWAEAVLAGIDRFAAVVIGNGLGLDAGHAAEVRRVVAEAEVPVVVDADALTLLGAEVSQVAGPSTILTPHEGEFGRLAGVRPGPDRLEAVRELARGTGAVVLLKGPTTLVASPDGRLLASASGDQRLASLGTGDVLAGLVGALCACGLDPFHAAAAGAFIHGLAGDVGWRKGLVAGDLVGNLPSVLDALDGESRAASPAARE